MKDLFALDSEAPGTCEKRVKVGALQGDVQRQGLEGAVLGGQV